MAEKRDAGFNIPLNFYDGPEVDSIPKRIRSAAVGVWSLAGNYAATQLTDGYVPAGVLKTFGCTDAIRAALKVTINKKGELSPLWVDARNGGVQLTNWPKHQRTNEEVTTYRAREAERKRLAREAQRAAKSAEGSSNLDDNFAELTPNLRENFENADQNVSDDSDSRLANSKPPTSKNAETSGRTTTGRPANVRATSEQTKTETETESLSTYVHESATDSNGRGSVAATPGAELVNELIPRSHPDAVRTMLRIRATELLRSHPKADVAAALELWLSKPSLGPNALPSLVSEVVKTRAAPAATGRQPSKLRAFAELAAEERALEQAQAQSARKELT